MAMRDNAIILGGLIGLAALGMLLGGVLIYTGRTGEGIIAIIGIAPTCAGALATSYVGRKVESDHKADSPSGTSADPVSTKDVEGTPQGDKAPPGEG
jgi:uncharacterized protein YcfJ